MMSNNKIKNRYFRNPDFQHKSNFPLPAIEEIDKEITKALSTDLFFSLRKIRECKLRDRILTFPVIVAIVMTKICRRIPSITEIKKVIAREKILWLNRTIKVSQQAISKRLQKIPSILFLRLLRAFILRNSEKQTQKENLPNQDSWSQVLKNFSVIWITDASTLEALKKKLKILKNTINSVLGGKMLMIVEAFNHNPVDIFYTEKPQINEKTFSETLLNVLPINGLLIFDMGFFSFKFFDAFTNMNKFFITRLRAKVSYKVIISLREGPRYREQIIQMGKYRSNRCQHPVRLISVLWNCQWYHYITNVLDSNALSAQQVCILYRERWHIETAFCTTKRLLDLAYLWSGDKNTIQIQLFSTWIFYTILNKLCQQVAKHLNQSLKNISKEMLFRSFYHYSQDKRSNNLVNFIVKNAKELSIIKKTRKHHRNNDAQQIKIWGTLLTL